jgi:Protein of unknown function (DUF1553)/Protein of unknown function (DUF1549)
MKCSSILVRRLCVPCIVGALLVVAPVALGGDQATQGLRDPAELKSLTIETGRTIDGEFLLDSQDATQQLVVTGHFASGQARDLTRVVAYDVHPAGVVELSPSGIVLPRADGYATITVKSPTGSESSIRVRVTNFTTEKSLNFERHIQPILTRFNCNSGSCHGKAGGQNGFALSLHGFELKDDYQRLVSEGRGRRIFPAQPDHSLLLLKPSGKTPHGGGVRLPANSASFRVLKRWIVQGMPFGNPDDPQVVRIEVIPAARMMPLRGEQQLAVVAHYADGSTQDVTGMSYYESNTKELAQASPTGLISILGYSGSASVLVRYQGNVATFRAPIPLGAPVDRLPPPKNFIDELVFKQLKSIGLPPSEACSDEVFIRRVTIDVAGRLPTPAETEKYLADANPLKRDRKIDELLECTEHADYFARKWTLLLRSRVEQTSQVRGSIAIHQWLREAIYHNKPYNDLVGELLTASGDLEDNPLVNWWRQIKDQSDQVESTAQVFLGVRLQCARCHHHPFDQWSQQDYYGLAAFFSRVGRKFGKEYQANVERIYHERGVASIPHPRTKIPILPTGLGGKPLNLSPDDDPREALVQWMTAPENPYFSRALVNRYWKHFFSRGLVDPEDDMRATNPASNPELLEALAQHFVKSHFDLKDLVRTICQSRTYQLSTEANAYNLEDKQHHARFYPRRMAGEVLLDSIDDVLMTKSNLGGAPPLPPEARAVQLPHFPYPSQYFLQIFGTPEGSTSCECERIDTANLAQCLHLMNSGEVLGKVSSPTGRAAALSADASLSAEKKVRHIFLLVYSRAPKPRELELALRHLSRAKNQTEEKASLEDLLWALINTKEFMYNH